MIRVPFVFPAPRHPPAGAEVELLDVGGGVGPVLGRGDRRMGHGQLLDLASVVVPQVEIAGRLRARAVRVAVDRGVRHHVGRPRQRPAADDSFVIGVGVLEDLRAGLALLELVVLHVAPRARPTR